MVNEAEGNACVAAARAGLQIESQQRMVPKLFAERIKLQTRQFGEIRRSEFALEFGTNAVRRA
jgi:hypothetical protein